MLSNFPLLKMLSLSMCDQVSDVRPLSSLTRLIKLDLRSCYSITGAGFACLSFLTSLQDLNVCDTKINDEGLRAITTSLTRLIKLSLGSCNSITGAGFACLSFLTSLQDLFVSRTKINNEGLRAISTSLTRLAKLSLGGCDSITGAGRLHLSSLTSLQDLNLCDVMSFIYY